MLKSKFSLYESLFGLLILVFLIFEIPLLNLPFLFDELWVYGPAVQMMSEQGPSLMPDVISPDFSRGHPLLFHALYGLWIQVFGDNLISIKSLSLLTSITLLITLYFIIRRWINAKMAFLGSLFLVLQPLFLAQATMVLPEMMLALLTLLTVFFYWEDGFSWKYILSGIALVLTKESGIVIIGCIILFDILFGRVSFIPGTSRASVTGIQESGFSPLSFYSIKRILATIPHAIKHNWKHLMFGSLPLLAFAIFLVIQKLKMGWFLFPEHIGYIQGSVKMIAYMLIERVGAYLFIYQGRNFLFFSGLIGIIWLLYRKHLLPNMRLPLLLFTIIALFTLFSAMNFFTNRYLLCLVPLYIIMILWIIQAILQKNTIYWAYIILFLITQYPYLQKRDISDNTMGFVECVKLNQELINYCVETIPSHEPVFAIFVTRYALGLYQGKYLTSDNAYKYLPTDIKSPQAKYYIISNIEYSDPLVHYSIRTNPGLKRLKRIEKDKLWAEVYQKIK